MVCSDWSLLVQSGCCVFDPFGFQGCVVFSKRFTSEIEALQCLLYKYRVILRKDTFFRFIPQKNEEICCVVCVYFRVDSSVQYIILM